MSSIDKVWQQILNCSEPDNRNSERMLSIFEELIFSPKTKYKDIRELVENTDLATLRLAIDEIEWIPPMEVGEDGYIDEDETRYFLYGNFFREKYLFSSIMGSIWQKAKPKNKKNFF
ncbi:hypothetical protein [Cytobacillus praedii]|uniref:hypothetical protein n=1 Tax=Cytobacillus praedii TaxID=1742358 RepID=UPI002E229085|nr:hypothetical protein [Cytobacillus praedii]